MIREINESYTPYVVETSIGLDRMFLALLSYSYCEEDLDNEENRIVLKIPPILSFYKSHSFFLLPKRRYAIKLREIISSLRKDFNCQYEEKDSIGKRYRRQDFEDASNQSVTIDHQTLKDGTVTIRDRGHYGPKNQ